MMAATSCGSAIMNNTMTASMIAGPVRFVALAAAAGAGAGAVVGAGGAAGVAGAGGAGAASASWVARRKSV